MIILTYQRTHRARNNFIGEVEDVIWDRGAHQELRDLIAEVVAVVAKKVVSLRGVAPADLLQIVLKDLLGYMRHPEIYNPDWCTIRCPPCRILLDAGTKIVLSSIYYHPGMPVTSYTKEGLNWPNCSLIHTT